VTRTKKKVILSRDLKDYKLYLFFEIK